MESRWNAGVSKSRLPPESMNFHAASMLRLKEHMNGARIRELSIATGPSRSASKVQEANHHVRNMVILGLALEVAVLATLAAYEFSSIFRFQN